MKRWLACVNNNISTSSSSSSSSSSSIVVVATVIVALVIVGAVSNYRSFLLMYNIQQKHVVGSNKR